MIGVVAPLSRPALRLRIIEVGDAGPENPLSLPVLRLRYIGLLFLLIMLLVVKLLLLVLL